MTTMRDKVFELLCKFNGEIGMKELEEMEKYPDFFTEADHDAASYIRPWDEEEECNWCYTLENWDAENKEDAWSWNYWGEYD